MNFDKEAFDRVYQRVENLYKDKIIASKDQGLIHLLLAQRFLRESDEVREAIIDGGNDCGVDAIFIDRTSSQPTVNIIQSKYHESERKAANPFKYSSLDKVLRFFEILKNKSYDLSKLTNPYLEQKILEIRDLQNRDFPKFKVWLISNGMPCVPHEIAPTLSKLKSQEVSLEEFHLSDFIEFCIKSHSSRPHHTFRVKDSGVIESGNTELYSVVGYISAHQLYHILKDLRDERKMDYSLFNMNVRCFLGIDNPINKEIFRSASSKDNYNFSSLNNGLTMVGTEVRVLKTDHPYKIGVKKMSIVNGAQTCSAIFDCMKDQYPNFENFKDLSVLFRLFKTDDYEKIDKIAISTNSQNRIKARDLKANDNFQIRLEKELAEHGIIYARKRGDFEQSVDEETETKKLDALKAGQLILSYSHFEPSNAKSQSDRIFSDWYNKIFADINVQKLIRAYDLYTKIEEYQMFISDEIRIRGISRAENTFVTYGGFHVLTLCSKLESLYPDKTDDELIQEALDIIAECLNEAGQPAYYSFFRNNDMTEKMLQKCSEPNLFDVLKAVQ